ncbi:MAG: S8 family peptidase [Rhizobacter sp.]|nr:S8 family peptidase [Chlorobiales bacterium]
MNAHRLIYFVAPVAMSVVMLAVLPLHAGVPQKKIRTPQDAQRIQSWWKPDAAFVPDAVIVKYRSSSVPPEAFTAAAQVAAKISILSQVPMFPQAARTKQSAFVARTAAMTSPKLSASDKAALASVDLSRIFILKFSAPRDAREVAMELSALPEVEYAEPQFVDHPFYSPNDPDSASNYWPQTVEAAAAWEITKGDTSVVIGVVDDGVQWDHIDLLPNLRISSGEISGNGIDDDGNGYTDDIHGWDFANGDNNPSPTIGSHGTHCAGIAAAATDNGLGIASLGFNSRLLPAKAAPDNNPNSITHGYEGIVYCADNGAKVISCSWGGGGQSLANQEVVTYAALVRDAIVVAAAGNSNIDNDRTPTFPASYKYAFAVGATNAGDTKGSYSHYGTQSVDVMAPGTNIWSTIPTNTFDLNTGTSMACPMAASLIALVRAKFPALTAEQAGEQVRITADNINLENPGYENRLGHGRINALRAVSDSSLTAIRVISATVIDPNGDDFLNDGESVKVNVQLKNFLQPASAVTVSLSTANPNVTISAASFAAASMATLAEIIDSSITFNVNAGAPFSEEVEFFLTITSGSTTDYGRFFVTLKPAYRTLSVAGSAVQTTLTNRGLIGYNDFSSNTEGVGFKYRGENLLYESSLAFGYSGEKYVDAARDPAASQNADFTSSLPVAFVEPSGVASLEARTTFTDANAPAANRIGLSMDERLYLFSDAPDTGYALVHLNLTNTSGVALTNFYAGFYFDWDVGNAAANLNGYDSSRGLGYTFDPASLSHAGVANLDSTASFRAITNAPPSRDTKWNYLSGGTGTATIGAGDMTMIIGAGPFTIAAGGTLTTAFALSGGQSLAELQANIDAAKLKWQSLKTTLATSSPAQAAKEFRLMQNYPNPFNPNTVIAYQLSRNSEVRLKVFDVLGREVATLVNAKQAAGNYSVRFDASNLSSGIYFYRLNAGSSDGRNGSFIETKKMLFIK